MLDSKLNQFHISDRISLILIFIKYSFLTSNAVDSSLNRLHRHLRLGVSGGEGVHVGENEVAGAVAAEGGFVFTADYEEGFEHVLRVFLGQAVEVEIERVEAGRPSPSTRPWPLCRR